MLFFYIILNGFLFIRLNETFNETYITYIPVNGKINRNDSVVVMEKATWLKMVKSGDNSTFFVKPVNISDPIIKFRLKFIHLNSTVMYSNWTTILYDINLQQLCYTNIPLYTTAIIVIIIAIIYLSITLISKYFCMCNKPINYAVYYVFY